MAYKGKKNKLRHYAVIVGARPNFMKAAPLLSQAKSKKSLKFTLIHTGQHFDDNMSKVFFDELKLTGPKININTRRLKFSNKIGVMANRLKEHLSSDYYDGVIVFGDVISTLVGAMAAAKNQKLLIHVEAGLRSNDRRMPEETARIMVDHISDLLFTTEPSANHNLLKEGISKKKIKYVGNLMIESLEIFKDKIAEFNTFERYNLKNGKYIVATVHRQENTDSASALSDILTLINKVNKHSQVVMPLHPGTREKIKKYRLINKIKNLKTIEPQGYLEFMNLILNSKGVITDSGGIQEETSHLGIPCCTLRDNTERPITIRFGSNKLFPESNRSVEQVIKHLNRRNFKSGHIPFWDNKVSKRILKWI